MITKIDIRTELGIAWMRTVMICLINLLVFRSIAQNHQIYHDRGAEKFTAERYVQQYPPLILTRSSYIEVCYLGYSMYFLSIGCALTSQLRHVSPQGKVVCNLR